MKEKGFMLVGTLVICKDGYLSCTIMGTFILNGVFFVRKPYSFSNLLQFRTIIDHARKAKNVQKLAIIHIWGL